MDLTELLGNSGNLATILNNTATTGSSSSMSNPMATILGGPGGTMSNEDAANISSQSENTESSVSGESIPGSSPSSSSPSSAPNGSGMSPYDQMNSGFLNYATMYKSPREVNNTPQNLMGYYSDALLTGSSISQIVFQDEYNAGKLPGNRYFINTQTKCLDNSGNIQNRSVLIDNINETTMDNFPSDERGLMYSFFASLGTLQIDKTPSITPSTAPVSSTVHLRSDMLPNCQLVKVKTAINIDNAPLAQAYMTSDDINKIDQTAIEGFSVKEGYDGPTPLSDHLYGTMNSTHAGVVSKNSAAINKMNEANSNKNKKVDSIKETHAAKIKNVKTLKENDIKSVAAAKKKAQENAKARLLKSYKNQYSKSNYTMDKLFDLFINYQSSNSQETITPLCIYYTLSKVDEVPESFDNVYMTNADGKNCSDQNYDSTIRPGKFIDTVKRYALLNYYHPKEDKFELVPSGSGENAQSVDITKEYVPPKTICQMDKNVTNNGYFGNTITYTPNNNSVNENYTAFWNKLEPYREYMIEAIMTLDNPTILGSCPPKDYCPPEGCLKEGFENQVFKPVPQNITMILVVLVMILLLCFYLYL